MGNQYNTVNVYGSYGAYGVSAGGNGGTADEWTLGSGNKLINQAKITGGGGGNSKDTGGAGGTGVFVGPLGIVQNDGTIFGGFGGEATDGTGGNGGVGVYLDESVMTETKTIQGGLGGWGFGTGSDINGGQGGAGAVLTPGAQLYVDGTVGGGEGGFIDGDGGGGAGNGGGGVYAHDATVEVDGSGGISGGTAGDVLGTNPSAAAGAGGIGVDLVGSMLTSDGLLVGGTAGYSYAGQPGAAGDAVVGSAYSAVINDRQIRGGGGNGGFTYGASGGVGVALSDHSQLTNNDMISGGSGGSNGNRSLANYGAGGTGGLGGSGVSLESYSVANNHGGIYGGAGGWGLTVGGAGGIGGEGVLIANGSMTNYGLIRGGYGGRSLVAIGGAGGAGVYLNGGTLINAGTIDGGTGAHGAAGTGAGGDAVVFGTVASTLVVDPVAVFNGQVVANGVNDTLELAGATAAVFAGLGTKFIDFTSVAVDAQALWTLKGVNSLAAGTVLNDWGALTITGHLSDAGSAAIGIGGILTAGAGSTVQIENVTLDGGELAGAATAAFTVGCSTLPAYRGTIKVNAGGSISGFGTIAGASLVDDGSVTATGGQLVIDDALRGQASLGTLTIDAGATLELGGAASGVSITFATCGDETLILDSATLVTSAIAGFGVDDIIDLRSILSTSLKFSGHTLKLYEGNTEVAHLNFLGSYSSINFERTDDGHGGTLITYQV